MWPTIQTYLAVMAGGALGVAARLFLSNWFVVQVGSAFPWGTIVVNVSGCLAIGLFTGLTGPDGVFLISPLTRQVVTIGVLGGFTTFSSFSLQTITLFTDGEWFYALANVALSLVLCLLGTWGGLALSQIWPAK